MIQFLKKIIFFSLLLCLFFEILFQLFSFCKYRFFLMELSGFVFFLYNHLCLSFIDYNQIRVPPKALAPFPRALQGSSPNAKKIKGLSPNIEIINFFIARSDQLLFSFYVIYFCIFFTYTETDRNFLTQRRRVWVQSPKTKPNRNCTRWNLFIK